ncbi:MAG: hypothetical protein ACR2JU_00120 [Nocardioidaceae bacterium]
MSTQTDDQTPEDVSGGSDEPPDPQTTGPSPAITPETTVAEP